MIHLSLTLVTMAMGSTEPPSIHPITDLAECLFTVPPTMLAMHLPTGIIVTGLELESETETSKLVTTPMEQQCFE